MNPSIGRIVLYRSRTGRYTVPAIVTATRETLDPEGVEKGQVPPITADGNVHLTVFSPGLPLAGHVARANFAVPAGAAGSDENMGGSYREWDIPLDEGHDEQAPGTWRWPGREDVR